MMSCPINEMNVILASKSPRRRELLSHLAKELGFEFGIVTEEVDEALEDSIPPIEGVRILAERKGEAVASKDAYRASLVISSDTLVELDGKPLGKPKDRNEAIEMLTSLSGRGHFVRTGIAVRIGDRILSETASTEVVFREIPLSEIEKYVDSGEPMDKAGAYGIQGYAGNFVTEYRGEFDTVVGLSLSLTKKLILRLLEAEND